jgi:AcrR family transcriptional regulator
MDDIARKLGISKSAICQYFESKDKLLAALYTSGPENLRSQFSTILAGRGLAAAAETVFNMMSTRANANLFADYLAEASRNEDLQRVLRENIEKFNAVVEDLLKDGDAEKTMSPEQLEEAHQVAAMLGLIFNGLACWLAVGVPESEASEVWGRSVDMLLLPYEKGRGPPSAATLPPRPPLPPS